MPDSHRPLPVTIEEITREWLTAALRTRQPDVTVEAFEIIDIERGTCTKIRLGLRLNEAGARAGIPERVILKGGFEPHSREMAYMHLKEVVGYRDILPVLKLPCPQSYFADYDEVREQGIVIMEDLVSRGVIFCKPQVPQTHEQVARRLTVLAQFHAKSWNSKELLPGGRWYGLEPQQVFLQRDYFNHTLTAENWQRFIGSPRGASASVRFHDRHWMIRAIDLMTKYSQLLPHSVLHGDTHLGNLYVDRDGEPGFFDSISSRGPGMAEIAYHISCALDSYDRARWEAALVKHYLDELARNGVAAPGFDEAMRQYGIFLAYGFAVWIANESFFQTEAANTAYAARVNAAMIDHDTIGLLDGVERYLTSRAA